MNLPNDFQFSQSSLQDYVECRRRFQYRYIMRLVWPAVEAEPAAEHRRLLRLGGELHRMIHQHILGVPEARLTQMAHDEDLKRWWENYLRYPFTELPELKHAEISMSVPLAGYRLVSKYDLLAIEPGVRAVIVDWKATRRRPSRTILSKRLQTRVYPYVLLRVCQDRDIYDLRGMNQVDMVYWFAEDPQNPERFTYDENRYDEDETYLSSLVKEIEGLEESDFDLTPEEVRCQYCLYRSLCQRGIRAGALQEWVQETEENENMAMDFEFDQISEIEF